MRSAAALILGVLLLPTVGCSSESACAAAPSALECPLSVAFRGTVYLDDGAIRLPKHAEPWGTGHVPVCHDNFLVDECGQVSEPTEDDPPAEPVYLVSGFDPVEVIAIRWDRARPATVFISDDLSGARAEELRAALEPSRPRRR